VKLTELLGVAGFALAVVSLLINLALSWLKWPRIAVEVRAVNKIDDPAQTCVVTTFLAVINNGSEAITIRSIGFTTGKRRGGLNLDIDALDAAGRQGGVLPTVGGKTAVFPARIEAHDCRIYEWDESVTRGFNYWGYAERYKSFRWWPHFGRWPDTARAAAVADVADTKGKAPSIGVMLLRDIQTIFSKHDGPYLMTYQLLTDLRGIEEGPWSSIKRDGSGIDARGLAKRLAAYEITSCNIRDFNGRVSKGYYRAAFADAWKRYVTSDDGEPDSVGGPPDESATSATSATADVSDTAHQFGDPCSACGEQQLWAPESIERSVCGRCWQTVQRNNQPKEGAA